MRGGIERPGGGGEQQVLRQHVQAAGARRIAIQFAGGHAEHGGLAFQDFEAVGGNEHGLARLVHAVIAERPTRCSRRDTPFGAPTWITWSTPPQSMPRSSEDVATTARRSPRAIAASTRRRWARSRLP